MARTVLPYPEHHPPAGREFAQANLFGLSNLGHGRVAFWSIDTPIAALSPRDALGFTAGETRRAATMQTRLTPIHIRERFVCCSELGKRCGRVGAGASDRSKRPS